MNADPPSPGDEALARQTQAGSLVAFEELVYRYEARIYRFVTQCGCAEADAREVTQDAFIRAFQAIGQFQTDRSFASWLFTIARRKCVDHHRSAPRVLSELPSDLAGPENPAEALARREDGQNLWTLARRCLPEVQFQALWLRYAEELDVAEIAGVLGRTRTHVKVLLFRARKTLGGALDNVLAARAPDGPAPAPGDRPAPRVAVAATDSLKLSKVAMAASSNPGV